MAEKEPDKYRNLVKSVLEELARLDDLSTLHLTSIAKAIESATLDTRKIIFRPKPKTDFEDGKPIGIMLTQEYRAFFVGAQGEKTIYEHLLYYPIPDDSPEDRLKTRFLVAHELGHILIHASKYTDDNSRIYRPIDSAPGLYAIDYTDEEESAADIFAAILCDQREQPVRPNSFREPCLRSLRELLSLDVFSSDVKEIIPALTSCML